MIAFLIWLTLQLLVWGFLTYPLFQNLDLHIWRLLGVAVYFSLFFLTPLFSKRNGYLSLVFCLQVGTITWTFFPQATYDYNPYVLLTYALLMAEAAERLPFKHMVMVFLFGLLANIGIVASGNVSLMDALFHMLFFIMLFTGLVYYKIRAEQHERLLSRYERLYREFRMLKRRIAQDEESARQEERQMIGQEIHDSVGHKLTSLIMQLEAYRIQSDTKAHPQLERLKHLAHESLEETRRAVKTFKQKEVGGLQGVIRLIRKLELESFIRIYFSANPGAFAAPLTGEQSFAIYRAVQEGLTNIMKHSQAREAQITFDAPGGSIFRFEMINPIKHDHEFKEGYGLASMRERFEKLGGGLDIQSSAKQFILRGWVRLTERGDLHDSSASGRRSNDGSSRSKGDD